MENDLNIERIEERYFVAAQIEAADVEALAELGITTVICNRPDGEDPGQPTAAEIGAACESLGMRFSHFPVSGMPIPRPLVSAHLLAIAESEGNVLAYCRSGQRSAMIYRAARA